MPGHRKRRQFKQTDAFTRGMVIGLKRTGWSIRQIAADTHLGASTVHRLWRRCLEQGNVAIYRNVGATRVTSARVDRRILRQAVAAPQATCTAILQHVQDTLDHSISTRTISRRLVANGLHSCRPLRRLPLTPPNRRQRLEWCRARSTWMTEWHRVVFSDESCFCLSSDSRRVRVWRRRGERSNPAAIVERLTVRQRGIMVWGAIAYDSRSPLLRIQGTMTAQRYVDDVLRPVTLPYLQGVPNALNQQDNARPHTARISQQALQDVQMLPWLPYSPDLSPIEHVWDIIGRRLHALPQPRSEDELWQMVEREWRAIPQDAIRTLIDSLPRRVAACIAVREEADVVKEEWKEEDSGREGLPDDQCDVYQGLLRTEDSPSYSTVKKWVAAFELGRINTEDEHGQRRPVESVTQENIDKIHDLVMLDRRMTVRQIEETLGIPKTTVDRFMREHLGLRKLSARWVPKPLTPDQKAVRRKHSGSPPPKKAKTVPSAEKVMVSVFWDSEGVLLLDFLNKGQTITGDYYANFVKQLREAIKEKRRGKLSRKIVYHQDNAPSHRSLQAMATIYYSGFELLPHAPYSPDLAPSDFNLFPHLKKSLSGIHFRSNEEVIDAVTSFFESLETSFFLEGIKALEHRWKKCIDLKGDYVEG
ncbi:hypothetical protein LAZ67_22001161 [Cordylochernes scorpioides]|uniref:Transposase n=1 Tax=Cordylochernes scorpioides TaxID=51811 RepID=A0ABY6LPT1_9ARAC|nr:hypothetical protein LAZ67_22001161 [Cordylochernes scorpioides]